MEHVKLFEQFINESSGKQIASKYDATPISDFDPDDLFDYLSDKDKNQLKKILSKYKDTDFFNNQEYVRDNGDSWEDHLEELKTNKIKHDFFDYGEDSIVFFKK